MKMSRVFSSVLVATTLAVGLLSAAPAEAYCIDPDRWEPDLGAIPVYVSTDGLNGTSLEYVGLGSDWGAPNAEIEWVKAAIAIINEGSHDAPRLYYAGTDSTVGVSDWSTRQPGITVMVYGPCEVQCTNYSSYAGAVYGIGQHANKAAIRFRRGAGAADYPGGSDFSCQQLDQRTQQCVDAPIIWWTDPEDAPVGDRDFAGVLVHEFLHALGLQHTSEGSSVCDINFDDNLTANSNMYVPANGFMADWRRRLRRDDVEGLRALWGEPGRSVKMSTSTIAQPSAGSWSTPSTVSGITTNTPVTLATASRYDDTTLIAGFTSDADEIRYRQGKWGPSAWGFFTTTVPDPQGGGIVTYDRVATARGLYGGTKRTMVAWYGTHESSCCQPEQALDLDMFGEIADTRVWWRVHDGSSWLTPQSTDTTRFKELGLGYDPRTDLFVLAYLDTCRPDGQDPEGCLVVADDVADQWLHVRTVKAWLGGGGCTQALATGEHVLAVGNVSCDYRSGAEPSRCVIPITTVHETGPQLRFIEGEIKLHDGYECFVREVDPPTTIDTLAVGTPSGALDTFLTAAGGADFVGAWVTGTSGTDWSQVYTFNRSNATGWLLGPQEDEHAMPTDYWPISVGNINRLNSSPYTQWRAISY